MARRKLIVGNWKMHGLAADIAEIEKIAEAAARFPQVDVGVCVPATLIERAVRAVPNLPIGAQDVHHAEAGAHTGCISTAMLADAGAAIVIVGHSERREAQRESDEHVRAKAEAGLKAGLLVILPFYMLELAAGRQIQSRPESWAAIGYVAVFPSLIAYLFFNRGVELIGSARAGQFLNLMPAIGAILSVLILREPFRPFHAVGIVLIGAGILLANWNGKAIRKPAGSIQG